MSWWTKNRGKIIGSVLGTVALGPGIGTGLGAGLGAASDNAGGVTNLLFGKPKYPVVDNAPPPSRDTAIQDMLNNQLDVINRRKNSQLGTGTAGDQTATLATSTLFGL